MVPNKQLKLDLHSTTLKEQVFSLVIWMYTRSRSKQETPNITPESRNNLSLRLYDFYK